MMKKFYSLTKTLLVATILLMGGANSVWADGTITQTWDFKTFVPANGNVTIPSSGNAAPNKNNGTTVYYPSTYTNDFGGKFAMQYRTDYQTTWYLRNTNADKGLCFYNSGKDEYFSILGLHAGDIVTITLGSGKMYFSEAGNCTGTYISKSDYSTETTGTPAQWDQMKSGAEYTITADGELKFQAKKSWVLISSIVVQTTAAETMTAPSIASEINGDARTITITSGSSNLLSGYKTYYTTDGSTPTSSSTLYTAPFDIEETTTIKAITISNSSAATASTVTTQVINMDVIDAPIGEVTGANGNNRIVTFTAEGADAIYYSETEKTNEEDGWSTYTDPVSTASATLWAYAKKGAKKSDVMSIATGAGTTIDLLAATLTHSGASQYTISNDQSSLVGSPTATVHYQLDGGAEQTSTSTSVNVAITANGTLTYWLTANGYGTTSKENASVYVTTPLATVETVNFCTNQSLAWAKKGSEVTISEDGDHTYYNYLTDGDAAVGEGVIATTFIGSNTTDAWRIQQLHAGTKAQMHDEIIAFVNVKAGQVVEVKCDKAPTIKANLTALPGNTYGGTYSYTVNSNGNALLTLSKSTILTYAYVKQDHVTATIGENEFTTFASTYPLDLTSATQTAKGFTAYRAASIAGSTVTFKDDVNQKVEANTGILLKGTAGATVYIPVAATGTALADNAFHVNTSGETFAAESGYTYYGMNKNSNPLTFGTFAPGTVAIPANKAYLKLNSSNELAARQIEAIFDDEILTGISEAEAATEAVAKEGKFIVDGKLVIFKKGMKFNANGQLVK